MAPFHMCIQKDWSEEMPIATRFMHMEGLQVMCLKYIPWGGFEQGAWKGLKTRPLSLAVLAPFVIGNVEPHKCHVV